MFFNNLCFDMFVSQNNLVPFVEVNFLFQSFSFRYLSAYYFLFIFDVKNIPYFIGYRLLSFVYINLILFKRVVKYYSQ